MATDLGPLIAPPSHSMPGVRGVYRCLETVGGYPAVLADPCFGADNVHVICSLGNTGVERLTATASQNGAIAGYTPELKAIGSRYPWRLSLAGGQTCIWDWYSTKNRPPGGAAWLCDKSNTGSGGALAMPVLNGHLATGPTAIDFDSVLVVNFKNTDRVVQLDQGNQGHVDSSGENRRQARRLRTPSRYGRLVLNVP